MAGRRKDYPYLITDELATESEKQKVQITSQPYEKDNECRFVLGIFKARNIEKVDPQAILRNI